MRTILAILALTIMVSTSVGAQTDPQAVRDRIGRPCVDVDIQTDQHNRDVTRQDCDYNMNATMQAGSTNRNATEQSGRSNWNATHQYQYDQRR